MTAQASSATVAHVATVVVEVGRYPYRPACSCGWRNGWGYVAAHSAQGLADAHVVEAGGGQGT